MKKEVLYIVIAGITVLCLPALLPTKFYKSDDKTVFISAIAPNTSQLSDLGYAYAVILNYHHKKVG